MERSLISSTCRGKRWNCTQRSCAGICIATGDQHYVTFDGATYSFEGACSYVLTKDDGGLFSVSTENVPCGSTGVTCTKSVYFTAGKMIVHLLRGKDITVNGARVRRLPRQYGATEKGTSQEPSTPALILDKAGLFFVVSAPSIGVSLLWDGGTRVYVQVSPGHQGKTTGLCGNYNSRLDDDFLTRHGSVEASVSLFADSWRLAQSCPESHNAAQQNLISPCKAKRHREGWARRACSLISAGPLFSSCRLTVSHSTYYDWCVRDSCACDSGGDCECLCTAIAAFAEECNRHGFYVRWRTSDMCPMQCGNGMEYRACGPVCQPTCRAKALEPNATYRFTLSCVEGCFCPSGTVFHDNGCILPSTCPCPMGGGEYPPGTMVHDDCRECTCVGGKWECKGKQCSELSTCAEGQLQCTDGRCVPRSWQCDSEQDCGDGSDEKDCEPPCRGDEFYCGENVCIPTVLRCDDSIDCANGADEEGCTDLNITFCEESEFECENGRCIHASLVCDRASDCGFGDFSDEANCAREDCAGPTVFRCSDSQCIPRRELCDGVPNCADLSDETQCVCNADQFACADEVCVPRLKVCDGVKDCSQGEDEQDCFSASTTVSATAFPRDASSTDRTGYKEGATLKPCAQNHDGCFASTSSPSAQAHCSEFSCDGDNTTCVSWKEVCDHVTHCPDQSDESIHCWEGCPQNMFPCDAGVRCLPASLVCDGRVHCKDGTDETEYACDSATGHGCSHGLRCDDGACINGSLVCDGVSHCSEGEDEIGCGITQPPTITVDSPTPPCPEFTCNNGSCLDFLRVCDDVGDCIDPTRSSASNSTSRHFFSDEVHCAIWTGWGVWGSCSKTCGSGIQVRNRECSIPDADERKDLSLDPLRVNCKGKRNDSRPCFENPCRDIESFSHTTPFPLPTAENECGWSDWSGWGPCFGPCGSNGVQWSFRSPLYPGRYGAVRHCSGETRTSRRCPMEPCGGCIVENAGEIKKFGEQWKAPPCKICTCAENEEIECSSFCEFSVAGCPNNGTLVEPSELGECCYCEYAERIVTPMPATAEVFLTARTTLAKGRQSSTQASQETLTPAPTTFPATSRYASSFQECRFDVWSGWSVCSHSCDVGQQERHRRLGGENRKDAEVKSVYCQGSFQQFRSCFESACKVDGSWGLWQGWSDCSRKCGGGVKFRFRACDNPAPSNGGLSCMGNKMKSEFCSNVPCSNGTCAGGRVFADASSCANLTPCKFTCADLAEAIECDTVESCSDGCYCPAGHYIQDDACVLPTKCRCSYDGIEYEPWDVFVVDGCRCLCENGTAACNERECVVNCGWSAWSKWSSCDRTCGTSGRTRRFRSPTSPAASGQEAKRCTGPAMQESWCVETDFHSKTVPCPPSWSEWQTWSECSSQCGLGTQKRERTCQVEGKTTNLQHCQLYMGNGEGGVDIRLCTSGSANATKCQKPAVYNHSCPKEAVWKCQRCPRTCANIVAADGARNYGSEEVRDYGNETVACLKQGECAWTCACFDGLFLQNQQCVRITGCDCVLPQTARTVSDDAVVRSGFWREIDCENCSCESGLLRCVQSLSCADRNKEERSEWTPWSEWTTCSKTCIHRLSSGATFRPVFGSRMRRRSCLLLAGRIANPGLEEAVKCPGPDVQREMCGSSICRTEPNWGQWEQWSACDRTCDGGTKTRSRIPLNQLGSEDFYSYPGTTIQVRACGLITCKNNQCPAGSTLRESCMYTAGSNGCSNAASTCLDLSGELYSDVKCNEEASGFSDQIECSNATKSCRCDAGLLWQDGMCVAVQKCNCYFMDEMRRSNQTFHIGDCFSCTCANGTVKCVRSRDKKSCQNAASVCDHIALATGPWSHWTPCSKSCDVGQRKRVRSKTPRPTLAWQIRMACGDAEFESEDCWVRPCVPPIVNGSVIGLGEWSSWGGCSVTCGNGGWMHRYRTCQVLDGESCREKEAETEPCTAAFPACSRDGSWGEWQAWTRCSGTCASSTCTPFRSRVRKCDNPFPSIHGKYCNGTASDFTECDGLPPCPTTPSVAPDQCRTLINGSRYSTCGPPCPRTCSDIQFCKKTCVPGCYCPPSQVVNENGTACVLVTECRCYEPATGRYYEPNEEFMLGDICKRKCICKGGIVTCERKNLDCPVHGDWCAWSHWTSCTRSCGVQNRTRVRSCECPAPSSPFDPSLACPGAGAQQNHFAQTQVEIASCHIYPTCTGRNRFDGWSRWGEWSKCVCDSLFSSRNRTCHAHCEGPWLEIRPCRFDPSSCGFRCPRGLVLAPCGSESLEPTMEDQCPRTCLSLSKVSECRMNLDEIDPVDSSRQRRWDNCVPQCACPEGYLIDPANTTGSLCVKEADCPCFFRDSIDLDSGYPNFIGKWRHFGVRANSSVVRDCKHCTCKGINKTMECSLEDAAELSCKYSAPSARKPEWSEWSDWSPCSASCDGGSKWRARLCVESEQNDGSIGGQETIECKGAKNQERSCNFNISCSMLPWQQWTQCSVTCGSGIQIRTRLCRDDHSCPTRSLKQIRKCITDPCLPYWSVWSSWSKCRAECGLGSRVRNRICTNSTHEFLKKNCAENPVDLSSTADRLLSAETVSEICEAKKSCLGGYSNKTPSALRPWLLWSSWSSWSQCSGSCGGGLQKRARNCEAAVAKEEDDGVIIARISAGEGCRGEMNQSKSCNVSPCPVNGHCPPGMEWKTCDQLCDKQTVTNTNNLVRRPASCNELSEGFAEFCSDPGVCVGRCVCEDGGILQRDGKCVHGPGECECIDDNGRLWPPRMEWEETDTQGCKSSCSCLQGRATCDRILNAIGKCAEEDLCTWSTWTPWTACNSTCEDNFWPSVRFRFRSRINLQSADDNHFCNDGTELDTSPCKKLPPCKCGNGAEIGETIEENCTSCLCGADGEVHCRDVCWTQWTAWSSCSTTCGSGGGFEIRTRNCANTRLCGDVEEQARRESRPCRVEEFKRPCPLSEPKCDIARCGDITCSNGQIQSTKENECCPTCVPEEDVEVGIDVVDWTLACHLRTEKKNITVGECHATDVDLNYCSGACESAVHVLTRDPFLYSTCKCCSHAVDKNEPFIDVSLSCKSGSRKAVSLPKIAKCECSVCRGSGHVRIEP